MKKPTAADQKKIHDVMHAFKHGKLNSGGAKGAKVVDRKQAIAIAMRQIGAGQRSASSGPPPWIVKGSQRRDVFPPMRR